MSTKHLYLHKQGGFAEAEALFFSTLCKERALFLHGTKEQWEWVKALEKSSGLESLSFFSKQREEGVEVAFIPTRENSLIESLHHMLIEKKEKLLVVESCTGGRVCACFTSLEGSSAYFTGGWVAYSNNFKEKEISLTPGLIQEKGMAHKFVVEALCKGALEKFPDATIVTAISGICSPIAWQKQGNIAYAIARKGKKADSFTLDSSCVSREGCMWHGVYALLQQLEKFLLGDL